MRGSGPLLAMVILLVGGTTPAGAGDKLYWNEVQAGGVGEVYVSELDGTHAEVLVLMEPSFPNIIDLDPTQGKIYWTDTELDRIQRIGFDGFGLEDVIMVPAPLGIAIDASAASSTGASRRMVRYDAPIWMGPTWRTCSSSWSPTGLRCTCRTARFTGPTGRSAPSAGQILTGLTCRIFSAD